MIGGWHPSKSSDIATSKQGGAKSQKVIRSKSRRTQQGFQTAEKAGVLVKSASARGRIAFDCAGGLPLHSITVTAPSD
jgi:hypothetical protein